MKIIPLKPKLLHVLVNALIFSLLVVVFYFKVFFSYSGYLGWHNFFPPISLTFTPSLFWNSYYAGGTPILTPFISMVKAFFFVIFNDGFGSILGYTGSVKIMFFIIPIFMLFSFYFLVGHFTKSYYARLLASIFFILNPSIFVMLAFGDYQNFIGFSLFFIGLAFLIKYSKSYPSNVYLMIIASLFLLFSIVESQIFYLGIILYPLIGVLFLRTGKNDKKQVNIQSIKLYISFILESLLLIVIISLVFVLPFIFGSFMNVGPSGSVAKPFRIYFASSVPFWKLIILQPNGSLAYSSISTDSPILSYLWGISFTGLIILTYAYTLVKRIKISTYLFYIILVASLIGSGVKSPISILSIWMYGHIPGFQLFPQSYLWDETLIAPLFSIILAIVLSDFFSFKKIEGDKIHSFSYFIFQPKRLHFFSKIVPNKKRITVMVIGLFLMTILFPVATQGYYQTPNGINNASSVLTSYSELYNNLTYYTNHSDIGVAFFPGDPYVYFGDNNSNFLQNPLITQPNYRVLNYATGNSHLDNYYTWLYKEFYDNKTKYMPELFSTVGIKYFVVLKNLKSYSYGDLGDNQNIPELMNYQVGLIRIDNNNHYEVFKSIYNISVAPQIKNVTLVLGNYDLLNYLSYSGVKLNNTPILFSSDINPNNFNIILPLIKRIVIPNTNSLKSFSTNISQNISEANKVFKEIVSEIQNNIVRLLLIKTPNSILNNTKQEQELKIVGEKIPYAPEGKILCVSGSKSPIDVSLVNSSYGMFKYIGINTQNILNGSLIFKDNLLKFSVTSSLNSSSSSSTEWFYNKIPVLNSSISFQIQPNTNLNLSMILLSNEPLSTKKVNLSSLSLQEQNKNFSVRTSMVKSGFSIFSSAYFNLNNISFNLTKIGGFGNVKGIYISFNISKNISVGVLKNNLTGIGTAYLSISFIRSIQFSVTAFHNSSSNDRYYVNILIKTLSLGGPPKFTNYLYQDNKVSISSDPIGYKIQVNSNLPILVYFPYYNNLITKNGIILSSLGGLSTIIVPNGNHVQIYVNSYVYTIYGFLMSTLLIGIYLLTAYFYRRKKLHN